MRVQFEHMLRSSNKVRKIGVPIISSQSKQLTCSSVILEIASFQSFQARPFQAQLLTNASRNFRHVSLTTGLLRSFLQVPKIISRTFAFNNCSAFAPRSLRRVKHINSFLGEQFRRCRMDSAVHLSHKASNYRETTLNQI